MAENMDNLGIGNFSIEDTIEMGAGNQELIKDLLSPETASSSPDDIEDIKEPTPETPSKKPNATQAETKGKTLSETEEEEKKDGQKSLTDFLLNPEDEENDDEEEVTKSVKTPKSEKKPEEKQPEESSEEDVPEMSQFEALAKDLAKLGVFTLDEGEELNISTPEEFLEKFQEEKRKGAIDVVNNFIGQFGEDYQKAFDAIFVKGVDPKEYFGTYNNVVSFSEMDLSDEKNQVAVLKQALSDQGFEQEDIDTEIERLKNYGDLETVATKHHKVLVKREAAKIQDLEQKAQIELQQKQAIKNQYINNVQSILEEKLKQKEFDGIPLNPKLATELRDFLLVDRYKTSSGETITEFDRSILELKRPENHEMKVKVALLLKILEKDPTLSTIQKTGVSKKSNELFGDLARHTTRTKSSSGGQQNKPNSWFL